ncbi:hypothetical protein GCM10027299_51870 [Larkinella ripae]
MFSYQNLSRSLSILKEQNRVGFSNYFLFIGRHDVRQEKRLEQSLPIRADFSLTVTIFQNCIPTTDALRIKAKMYYSPSTFHSVEKTRSLEKEG